MANLLFMHAWSIYAWVRAIDIGKSKMGVGARGGWDCNPNLQCLGNHCKVSLPNSKDADLNAYCYSSYYFSLANDLA